MARTRGNSSVVAVDTREKAKIDLKSKIAPDDCGVPRVLILPKDTCKDARIITLEHTRFLVCPSTGIYEFKQIAAPASIPRSCLLSSPCIDGEDEGITVTNSFSGYVAQNASFLIATAIDPLFLILPALAPLPATKTAEKLKNLYLSVEDYLTRMIEISPQFSLIWQMNSIKSSLEQRMAVICDLVEAGDEKMYRFNEVKLLDELLKKAKRITKTGLPSSMEEKLVRKSLEAPIIGSKRDDNKMHELAQKEQNLPSLPLEILKETETEDKSVTLSSGEFDTVSTSGDTTFQKDTKPNAASEEITSLLRLRVALSFIFSSYIPPHISDILNGLISSSSAVDFKPLDDYLAHLAKLRQDAIAARSLGDFSRKRTTLDDAGTESRPGKRQKETESKKKRLASASRGVKALEKVNVSGMKKMSHFFTKK